MTTAAKLVLDVDAKGVEKADGALEDLEGSAKKATRATKGLTAAEKGAATATKKLAKDTANLKRTVAGLATTYAGMATAIKAVSIASDFSEATATVKAITLAADSASKSFIALEAQARKLGATTRFSATQAAEAQVALLRSGLDANEVLLASANVLNLATVAQIELARAAEITAITLKQFGLDASQSERVVDVLSTTSNTAATTVEQLAEGLKFAAPVASKFGLTLEDTAAAMAVLSNSGLQASLAGTGLKGVISALANPTGRAAKTLDNLAQAAGLTADAFDINKRPLEEIFMNFKRAEASGKDMLNIFGLLKAPAALTLSDAAEEIAEFGDSLEDVSGNAQESADTINDALKGDILSLISALEELVLTVNESVGPSLREMIQFLTEVTRALAADSEEFEKFSTAAKLAATTLKFLSVIAAAFVAIKLVTAIGSAVLAIKGMIVALTALKVAIASTGIGLLVVGLGIAATAALEFSGAFDDAAESTEDLNAASRKLAKEEQARERLRAQQAANKRMRHDENMKEIQRLAEEEKKAEAEKKRRQEKAKAAAQAAAREEERRVEKLAKLQQQVDEEEFRLDFELGIAGLTEDLRRDVRTEAKRVQRLADLFEVELEFGANVDDLADAVRTKMENAAEPFTLAEIDDQVDEIFNYFDRLAAKQEELDDRTKIQLEIDAGDDALLALTNAADAAELQLKSLTKTGMDAAELEIASQYKEQLDALRNAAERAFERQEDGILPEQFIAKLHQAQLLVDRLAKTRALEPLILDGQEAAKELEDLARAGEFSEGSLASFEDATMRAIEGYRAQMQLANADTEALAESIDAAGDALERFSVKVAKQEVLNNLESVVVDTTNAFFTLFETLLNGSKTAGEAFLDFLNTVIRALFQKFVIDQTIKAISKAFDAIGAAAGVGNIGSAAAGAGSAAIAVASANGNAFDRSGHTVKAFADGGIIGGPTVFPLGLAGEAGPEAILPLSRGADGKLGVHLNERQSRRPGQNPFINRSLSPGASSAPTANELRHGSSRTTNVQMNITTPDAKSFRKSRRQINAEQLRGVGIA